MVIKLRTLIQHLAVGGAVLVAAPAFAQEETGGSPPEVEPDPSQALGHPGGEAGAETPQPNNPQTHTVVRGDTLWDLSGKYLNNSWYWPKVWSYNPQIANPHWIYPGNQIRFAPGDAELPTNVEVNRNLEVEEEPAEGVRTMEELALGRMPDAVWRAHNYYISKDAHAKAGQIVNADSEQDMLTLYDRVYIEQEQPGAAGQRYAVYRTQKELVHPITGEVAGYAAEVIGGVEVDGKDGELVRARITQAYRPIRRGDYIGPVPPQAGNRVTPSPTTANVKGFVIDTAGDDLLMVGEYYLVYIDLGTQDGVQRGNLLEVVTRGDGFTKDEEGLPIEVIGQVMVVDAQAGASTAIVTRSAREIRVGDKLRTPTTRRGPAPLEAEAPPAAEAPAAEAPAAEVPAAEAPGAAEAPAAEAPAIAQ